MENKEMKAQMEKTEIVNTNEMANTAATAEEKHLEFFGLPLTGIITDFKAALKGQMLKENPFAVWIPEEPLCDLEERLTYSNGNEEHENDFFAGAKARMDIFYTNRTWTVYGVRVTLERSSEFADQDEMRHEYEQLLQEKYEGRSRITSRAIKFLELTIYDGAPQGPGLGTVLIEPAADGDGVSITYYDRANRELDRAARRNDL